MPTESLAKLREGLHISASALKTFLTCPWKFRLQYVEGAAPEFRPSVLILGSAVHEAIAAHHRGLQAEKPLPRSEVLERVDAAVDNGAEGDIPLQLKAGETLESLSASGRGLVDVYLRDAQRQRVLAVEQPFQADLIDPRSGEVVEPKLIGVFDLVEADEEGHVSVVEIKTASKRWSAGQVDLDIQGSLYAEAVSQARLVPDDQEALIRYEILVKNKKPVLDSQYAVRRPGDREVARLIAVDALQAIERDAFFRNPGWACAGCQFRKQCGI